MKANENSCYVEKYVDELMTYLDAHREVFDKVKGLTWNILKKDLQEALKYDKGYFKNKKGEYRYVKGIEVTNDTGNLLRMGFNGEDRGVRVHYCELDDRKAGYYDVPIAMYSSKHNPNFTPEDELMEPTTKEEFERQVKRTIQNIIADYPDAADVQTYLDYMNGRETIEERYKNILL